MTVKKSEDENFIIKYFQDLNLRPARDIDQFWKNLNKKYGKSLTDKLSNIVSERSEGRGSELYDVKNQSLSLSIDFSSYSTDLYRKYFEWFINKKGSEIDKILDIGCDNGIVTCFYGLLFPEAEVIGIDINENAIKCANELKDKLMLKNISFIKMDINEIDSYFNGGYFDIISSVRTLHEIIERPETLRYWSLKDVRYEFNEEHIKLLSKISRLLKQSAGQLITWERLVYIEQCMWWVELLQNAGLCVDWDKSEHIKFHEVGDAQVMPLLVATNSCIDKSSRDDVVKFYIRSEITDANKKKEFENYAAEEVFDRFQDKELVLGLQVNYKNNSGDLRLEAWKSGETLLFYRYSNVGFRQLSIMDMSATDEIRDYLVEAKKQAEEAGHKTVYYASTKKRDESELNKV